MTRTGKKANTEKQDISSKGGVVSLDFGKTKLTCDGAYSRSPRNRKNRNLRVHIRAPTVPSDQNVQNLKIED